MRLCCCCCCCCDNDATVVGIIDGRLYVEVAVVLGLEEMLPSGKDEGEELEGMDSSMLRLSSPSGPPASAFSRLRPAGLCSIMSRRLIRLVGFRYRDGWCVTECSAIEEPGGSDMLSGGGGGPLDNGGPGTMGVGGCPGAIAIGWCHCASLLSHTLPRKNGRN